MASFGLKKHHPVSAQFMCFVSGRIADGFALSFSFAAAQSNSPSPACAYMLCCSHFNPPLLLIIAHKTSRQHIFLIFQPPRPTKAVKESSKTNSAYTLKRTSDFCILGEKGVVYFARQHKRKGLLKAICSMFLLLCLNLVRTIRWNLTLT